jgi:hypothetical protein
MLRRAETGIAERLGIPPGYLSPIGMHLLLTIGILCFEWDVVEMIFIYLSEIVVVAVLFAIVALFAPMEILLAEQTTADTIMICTTSTTSVTGS